MNFWPNWNKKDTQIVKPAISLSEYDSETLGSPKIILQAVCTIWWFSRLYIKSANNSGMISYRIMPGFIFSVYGDCFLKIIT